MKQAHQRPGPRSQKPTLKARTKPILDEHGHVKGKAKQQKQENLKLKLEKTNKHKPETGNLTKSWYDTGEQNLEQG